LTLGLLIVLICASLWWVASPTRVLYAIPLLVAFEFRNRYWGVSFEFVELCLVIAVIAWLWQFWSGGPAAGPAASQRDRGLLLLLAILAFPSIFFEDNLQHALSSYRDLLIPVTFFFFFGSLRMGSALLIRILKLSFVLALGNAALGILQYQTGYGLWFASGDELVWQAYKTGLIHAAEMASSIGLGESLAIGAYGGANNFATYLTVPFCLAGVLACSKELSRKKRAAFAAAAAVLFVALACTLFRSELLIAALSSVVLFLLLSPHITKRHIGIVAIAGGLLLSVFLMPGFLDWDQYGTLTGRWEMSGDALDLLAKHPLQSMVGGMSDLYHRHYAQPQDVHSMVLYCILQFGMPATLVFLGLITRWVVRCWRAAKTANGLSKKVLLAMLVPVAANIFLYGQTTMLFDSVQISMLLFFWLGVTSCLALRQECLASGSVKVTAATVPSFHGDVDAAGTAPA